MANYSTPSRHAARREQAVLLAEALERLSEDYREVIVLRHLEGLTFPDVAKRMNRSEDSVQKLWVRSLASLRRSLGGGVAS
jgi:RNA polymerase sigma-70 factor (ECF subfamily)